MRNLTKTLAAVSLLAPASAYPLGIGDIKLHSALNQNLDAEIALNVSSGENVSGLKVKLAPPDKFNEAGVPWSYFLSKIKFTSVVRADGSMIVKLSSKEALREPFLDFLLEVSWDKGNLYREFTVLVDPPVAYTQPVIPVVQKATQQLSAVNQRRSDAVVNANKRPGKHGRSRLTRRTDTLWKIAEETNTYNNVSIEQMMMAIYEVNPRAFYKKNVNALMAGHTLDIPEKEIILKLSKKQAMAAFKQQQKVWEGRVSESSPAQKTGLDSDGVKAKLKLEPPVDIEIPEKVVEKGKDVSIDRSGVSETEKDTSGRESLAAQKRMEALELQVKDMKHLLDLKDKQIARLQNQHKVMPVPSHKITADQEGKTVIPAAKETKVDVVKPVVKAETKPVVKPKPKPKPITQPESETGFWSDSFAMVIGSIGLAILAVLGVFIWRKRKLDEDADSESMFASASEISLPDSSDELAVPVMDDASLYDVGTVGESSFLSEFTPSDFDAFDTDQNEVDPISEADVYLAYGRYQQAEDLMRQAIADQPERDECKLKLLEIFYANENKSAFEEYATELVSSGKHNDQEFWAKVIEMGIELDPSCSLYTDKAGEKASFETIEADEDSAAVIVSNSSENTDENKVIDDLPKDKAIDSAELVNENGEIVDFDLSIFDEDEHSVDTKEKTDDNSLDFDLSVFDLDEQKPEQKAEATTEQIESVDFDLATEVETDESLETFDFSSETSADEVVVTDLDSSEKTDKEAESFDEFEFDFDLDKPPAESASLQDLNEGVSDLTDMDELETKIDLAKAYIDMGDIEAAKKITEEVLKEGNADQKKSAQSIIDQLE